MTDVPGVGTVAPIMGTRRASPDLGGALFGKTRRAVLGLLYARPDETFYLRQIIREVRGGQGAVQRELERLAEAGILRREARGRAIYYGANRACPIFAELHGLAVKTVGLADVLRSALTPLHDGIQMAMIYG
ncbi:MAG TPA: winged helix-turn-helix domain-containing protein, partial [Candidatus Acidoferrum sp.]|nr:winged helix-turn-helix domain-containing protein [Candidatus Acidoferrum sp.]